VRGVRALRVLTDRVDGGARRGTCVRRVLIGHGRRRKTMNNADRLHAAEAAFDMLTGGGRDLITAATEPTFQFYDGEIVKGYGAAADRAEREVRNLTDKINKAIDETNGKG